MTEDGFNLAPDPEDEERLAEAFREQSKFKAFGAIALASQLGFAVGVPIVLGALAGEYLHGRFGGGGLLLVAGILLGVALGAFGAFRVLMKLIP